MNRTPSAYEQRPLHPIDLSIWADFWDLLEHHGLSPNILQQTLPGLEGPVLVVGSGQGLVPAFLLRSGYAVTSLERSRAMARMSRRRRGLDPIVQDGACYRCDDRFKTIILNTGVLNSRTLGSGEALSIVDNISTMLARDGRLVVAFFRWTRWTDLALRLGFFGTPSSNVVLWRHRDDFGKALRLLEGSDGSADDLAALLCSNRKLISEHARNIIKLGESYRDLTGLAPDGFISEHSGFFPFPLAESHESAVTKQMSARGFQTMEYFVFNGGDTGILVLGRAPHGDP